MKKTILFLFMLLVINSFSAQEKGQFVIQAEADAGFLFCYPYQGTFNSIDLEAAVGPVFHYQVGDRMGVGIGVNYCAHDFMQCLPVFADAKYSFGSGKTRPYAEIRAGYAFCLKKFDTGIEGGGYPMYYSLEGFYSQLMLGYSIGHSDLGIGVQLLNLKEAGLEYRPEGFHTYINNSPKPGLFLHYAYNFQIK